MKKNYNIDIIYNHPCPDCGQKIGIHKTCDVSVGWYGGNPRKADGTICTRDRKDLIIEKLEAFWLDALGERDSYRKSYEEAIKILG